MPTKILAIDDSKTMRLAIKITFAAEDADVTSVSKGSEAVARAKQLGADVVLVDANLAAGEPSGYEVCRALKQDPATARIPVVMLVSGQTGVDEAKLAEVGGDDWLAKPFDTQELIDKVAAVKGKPVAKAAVAARPAPEAAEPAAAQSGTSKRPRPQNATQVGMPTPTPTPAPVPATTRPAATRTPVAAPAPTPAVATPAPTQRAARQPAAAPAQAVATPAPRTAGTPARPAAPAAAMTPSAGGAVIPIAIPIPFTAADSPTPGMVARIQQAAGAAGVDPRVAEAIASLSRDVIERIVWEVVPDLAESIIRQQQSRSA